MNGKFKTYAYGVSFILALASWFTIFSTHNPVSSNFCQIVKTNTHTTSTQGNNCVCPFEGLYLATIYNIMITILAEFVLLFSAIVFIKTASFLLRRTGISIGVLLLKLLKVKDAYGGFLNFRIRNYLALAFSTGILQPKICSL
jgi:hypothetical protein